MLSRGEVGVRANNAALNAHTHSPSVYAHPSLSLWSLCGCSRDLRTLTRSHGHLSGSCWPNRTTRTLSITSLETTVRDASQGDVFGVFLPALNNLDTVNVKNKLQQRLKMVCFAKVNELYVP